jgi:hypothetical protein
MVRLGWQAGLEELTWDTGFGYEALGGDGRERDMVGGLNGRRDFGLVVGKKDGWNERIRWL